MPPRVSPVRRARTRQWKEPHLHPPARPARRLPADSALLALPLPRDPDARRATTVRADRVTSRRVPRESTRWPPAPRRPAPVRTARRASTHWAGLRNAQSVEQERIRPRGVPHLKVRAHNAQRTRFLRHWERGHQIPVHPARRGKTQCRGVPTV